MSNTPEVIDLTHTLNINNPNISNKIIISDCGIHFVMPPYAAYVTHKNRGSHFSINKHIIDGKVITKHKTFSILSSIFNPIDGHINAYKRLIEDLRNNKEYIDHVTLYVPWDSINGNGCLEIYNHYELPYTRGLGLFITPNNVMLAQINDGRRIRFRIGNVSSVTRGIVLNTIKTVIKSASVSWRAQRKIPEIYLT